MGRDNVIRDGVHGYIALEDYALDLVDTAEMQRLRRIKQLDTTYLVYPSATHTRFEHVLGVYHLAKQVADRVDTSIVKEFKAAALLHDVGHGPFSHLSEHALDAAEPHESRSITKIRDSLASILETHGIDVDTVCHLIKGETMLGELIAGPVDVDRMDYLMRDAYYTGVAPGTVEADTIIRNTRLHENRVVFHEKAVLGIESMLTARYFMIPKVYNHHAVSIASRILEKAVAHLDTDPGTVMTMDDPDLVHALRTANNETARELMRRIDDRDLYKRAYTVPGRVWREHGVDRGQDMWEQEISEEAGVPRELVAAIPPRRSVEKPVDIPVLTRSGEVTRIDAVSDIYTRLPDAEQLHHPFIVATPVEHREAVGDTAETVVQQATGEKV